jgi:hypothetical protein
MVGVEERYMWPPLFEVLLFKVLIIRGFYIYILLSNGSPRLSANFYTFRFKQEWKKQCFFTISDSGICGAFRRRKTPE